MLTLRQAEKCGTADYGWLKARYSFSFGHYFDPELLGFSHLQVLNQEVLAPGATFQPRSYPKVDVLNLILQGEAEYRSYDGQIAHAAAGDALLLSASGNSIWQESNASQTQELVRLQLWLATCPQQNAPAVQQRHLPENRQSVLIASPQGQDDSLQLRQQIHISQITCVPGETRQLQIGGHHCYLQSVFGGLTVTTPQSSQSLQCGDGLLVREEPMLTIVAREKTQILLIDCGENDEAA
ncbi:pirin family protein [Tatumella saanichensis]|uniref:pirin family protein n=1 Tax=Tatumella saanichensis TaxID=480813 RepID=UPI0004A3F489|nr:pirin family protein [Tatumella saanichensis]